MADQTLAQNSALNVPPRPRPRPWLHRKLAGAWRVGRRWLRFMMARAKPELPVLVDFVAGNHVFGAMQDPNELVLLGQILSALQPERALEIGTAGGGTLLFLTRLADPQATIVSIDLPGGQFGGGYSDGRRWVYERFGRHGQKLYLLKGNSHSAEMLARAKAAFNGRGVDYLFIDGDHNYEGVKRDFEMYAPIVRKGGVIAFHDIANAPAQFAGGVPRFWREVKCRYRHEEIINDPEQSRFGVGVLYTD